MAKAKRSAHAELDELRQEAATERAKARNLDAQLEAAKLKVEAASAAVTDAYAADDDRLAAERRRDVEAAEAEVLDLQHRVTAAGLRVERARAEADEYARAHARDLLDEREGEAREVAANLTRAGAEVVRAHRAYLAMREEVASLVAMSSDGVTDTRLTRFASTGPRSPTRGSLSYAPLRGACERAQRFRRPCLSGPASSLVMRRRKPRGS